MPDEVRRFDDAAIGRAIDGALATIPAGHTVAVVAYIDVRGGASRQRLVAAARLSGGWSIMGTLSHYDRGPLEVEAAVRWSR